MTALCMTCPTRSGHLSYMPVYLHDVVCAYVRAYVRACMCARACVRACARACVHLVFDRDILLVWVAFVPILAHAPAPHRIKVN